jgi:hypothetical protein
MWDILRNYGYSLWLRIILNARKVGIFQSIDEVTNFTILCVCNHLIFANHKKAY